MTTKADSTVLNTSEIWTNLLSLGITPTEITAAGAIDPSSSAWITLDDDDGSLAVTIAAPVAGRFLIISQKDSGTAGHTVTLSAGTWDGTNDVATFNAQYECLVVFGLSATRYVVVANIGSVSFS